MTGAGENLAWYFPAAEYKKPLLLGHVRADRDRPPVDAQTQLRFVTWKSEATKIWERVIVDFEARHPDVKVVQEVGPQSSTEFHDLVTQKLRNRDALMPTRAA